MIRRAKKEEKLGTLEIEFSDFQRAMKELAISKPDSFERILRKVIFNQAKRD